VATHHAFTCPYCGRLGLTDSGLQEHVDEEHSDESKEVVSDVLFCISTAT
jgi:hypothetical protein